MLKIKDGYVLRQVAGQFMAIPVGKRVNDLHGLIALNETGAFLWEALVKETTVVDLTELLTEEYDVSFEEAEEAVKEFIGMLEQEKLLEESKNG